MSVFVESLPGIDIVFENNTRAEGEEGPLVLPSSYDRYEGVLVDMEKGPMMDPNVFGSALRASMSLWKKQLKKGVWIKLPIQKVHLVETAVQHGFWFHHAEPSYLMLVNWIPRAPCTLPGNASHRVGVGAVVLNDKREILVVQENSGCLRGTGFWKIPTGIVDEGEDIHDAVVREVKEETGIDAEFLEILAFREAHKAYFEKSDLFFVCMLRPLSFEIQAQELELEAGRWMPFEEYAGQPAAGEDGLCSSITEVCIEKFGGDYSGFIPVPVKKPMFCGHSNFIYRSSRDPNSTNIAV